VFVFVIVFWLWMLIDSEKGKEISWNLPGIQIYIGNKDWTSIMEMIPLVDMNEKRVVRILKNSFIKPALPMNLSEDDRNKPRTR
jgi:hypothetical protein